MEKLKDFIHDFSDIFFAIIIISIMFVVVSLNLGSWFNNSSGSILAGSDITDIFKGQNHNIDNNTKNNNNQSQTEDTDQKEDEISKDEIEGRPDTDSNETEIEDKQDEDINSDIRQNEENSNEENKTDNQEHEVIEAEVVVETKAVNIPNGASSTKIANILKDSGLIDNITDFDEACKNLNLASRLKPGTFEIPVNATIEDMVRIIAKQKTM